MSQDAIAAIVRESIIELNRQLPPESRLDPDAADVVLMGEGGGLDSLSLINLFVAVEERLEEQLDLSLSLVDASAEPEGAEAFHTLSGLIDWIVARG
ncbi:hypothetical protein [Magnetofaba australis]|uniref:Carrier domain-containing protein n=1 Tax=Magnetofaba australis IT-1 TaxID=1434232 RepID=A0A1Y2K816_9PROT|nr:hypothetical protein [Magnetofaba australis]OSM06779.1 hypothetical protein MAIT1_00359 [Magnetofaba australis IT-1]